MQVCIRTNLYRGPAVAVWKCPKLRHSWPSHEAGERRFVAVSCPTRGANKSIR